MKDLLVLMFLSFLTIVIGVVLQLEAASVLPGMTGLTLGGIALAAGIKREKI